MNAIYVAAIVILTISGVGALVCLALWANQAGVLQPAALIFGILTPTITALLAALKASEAERAAHELREIIQEQNCPLIKDGPLLKGIIETHLKQTDQSL